MDRERYSLAYFTAKLAATGLKQAVGEIADFEGWGHDERACALEGDRLYRLWQAASSIPAKFRSAEQNKQISEYQIWNHDHLPHLAEAYAELLGLLENAENLTRIAVPIIAEALSHRHVIAGRFDPETLYEHVRKFRQLGQALGLSSPSPKRSAQHS
jgi:hypothetical protein